LFSNPAPKEQRRLRRVESWAGLANADRLHRDKQPPGGLAPVQLILQKAWQLPPRHKVLSPENQDSGSDSKDEVPRAKLKRQLNPVPPRRAREQHAREASGLVSRSRRRAAHLPALPASRERNQQGKFGKEEFRAKALLNTDNRRKLHREAGLPAQLDLNSKELQVSKDIRWFNRKKRKAPAQRNLNPLHGV
jgi:hypothetical protein